MNEPETIIHIEWDGPCPLNAAFSLNRKRDYGLYQIYGGHPVYGNSALLYIGLAAGQTFGKRIPQETQWVSNRDAGRVEVYVGRLAGETAPDDETWDDHIRLAERILIFAHSPPMNTQKSLRSLERDLRYVHVLNWNRHRDLLPEVSGARWAHREVDFPNYHVFSIDEKHAPPPPSLREVTLKRAMAARERLLEEIRCFEEKLEVLQARKKKWAKEPRHSQAMRRRLDRDVDAVTHELKGAQVFLGNLNKDIELRGGPVAKSE